MLSRPALANHHSPRQLTPWLNLSSNKDNAELIHFSGANGFPVACYQEFLSQFQAHFQISGMDMRATWQPRRAPAAGFSMHSFADDLIAGLEKKARKPVIAMGHSLGGQISLIAALKRPELFSKLIIIDGASLPSLWVDLVYRKLPKSLLYAMVPLIRGSEERQRMWPSRKAFIKRYQTHPTFRRFTPASMLNYSEHGLFAREDGQFELVFDPIWESHIFRNIEFMWKFLRKTNHPTLLIRAQHSNIYSSTQFQRLNKRLPPNIHAVELSDTHHLLPFEQPTKTFQSIYNWLSSTK